MRKPLTAAAVLACAAAVSAVAPAAQAVQAPGASPAACTTAQPIEISSLIWNPSSVYPGQTSDAIATVVNCTGVTQSAGAEWLGKYVYPVGPPPGCPVIDPFIRSLTLPPFGTVSQSTGYTVPINCMATGLVVTVDILQNGHVVATKSAELHIKQIA